MPTGEVVGFVLFVTIVVGVYVAAATILVNTVRRRLAGHAPLSTRRSVVRHFILALAAAGTLCVAYGRFIEPSWLDVTLVQIVNAKVATSQPIRIAHISDLHCDPKPRLELALPSLIEQQRPDVVVFTGDCINSIDALPIFKRCLSEVAQVAPTFAVQGNWDIWHTDIDLFEGTGAIELRGQVEELEIRGTTIRFAGAAARDDKQIEFALDALASDNQAINVLLYHFPDVIHRAAERGVDLCCVGHTHGGQVALPFYGAVITRSKLGKRFEAGLYRVADTWLYINRGIGMEGKSSPRVRFWARPELTVLEITAD